MFSPFFQLASKRVKGWALTMVCVSTFGVGLLTGQLSAQTNSSANQAWWKSVVEDARAYVVHGAISGYLIGWARGSDAEGVRIDAAMDAASDAGLMTKAAAKYVHDIIYKKNGSGNYVSYEKSPDFSKTFGAYSALVDDFYVKHPTSSKATLGNILTCLTDKPAVTCDDTAKYASD